MIMKIGVATTDWSSTVTDQRGWPVPGGANWIRFSQNQGFTKNHLVVGTLVFLNGKLGVQTFDRQMHFDCAVIILQRYMDEWVPSAIETARSFGQIVVNDVDDWFWGLHKDNQAALIVDPKLNPKSNIDHYRKSLENSTAVTTSTPFLRDAIAQWGTTTHMIQNSVTAWRFTRRVHKEGTPIIGWCGSTGHRSGDLEIVAPALQRVSSKFKFHHTGSFSGHQSFAKKTGLNPRSVSTLPLLAPLEYPSGFTFDIGIVPLSDVPFNAAKSWIKGIEYAAAGIPFIASDMDEYRRLQNKYGIGRLASTTEEWVTHFEELLDPAVRTREATHARNVIDEHLDVRFMARQWDEFAWSLL
jgi:hypothetical protein